MSGWLLKALSWKAFQAMGFQVDPRGRRCSLAGVLQQAKSVGFSPKTVIDVGAAYGQFTLRCQKVFPEARYLLIEPLTEYEPFLDRLVQQLPARAEYVLAAAAAAPGEVSINVHPDLVGSSLYMEQEESGVNGFPRTVPAVTLDGLIRDRRVETPLLVKIDVQGAELDVLAGAAQTLCFAEYAILEVSLFEFFKAGPQLSDLVAYMKARGLVPYDLFELLYRPLDRALAQLDICFVKDGGFFRQDHSYATPEQREGQNRRFQLRHRKLLRQYRSK